MRRDYFTLEVHDAGWVEVDGTPAMPKLNITYEGPRETLASALLTDGDELPSSSSIDVSFRLQGSIDDPDAMGVLSLSDRLTGDFLVEMNAEVEPMLAFIRAARRYGETVSDPAGRFSVSIIVDDTNDRVTFEKRTLLVYNSDGSLLRQHSIIPSGVEL